MKYAAGKYDLKRKSVAGKPEYRIEKIDQNHIGVAFCLHGFHLALQPLGGVLYPSV